MKYETLRFAAVTSMLLCSATTAVWVCSAGQLWVVVGSYSRGIFVGDGYIGVRQSKGQGGPTSGPVSLRFSTKGKFGLYRLTITGVQDNGTWQTIDWQVHLGWIVGALFVLPIAWLVRHLSRRRFDGTRCIGCGYDIRATPDRCPECGAKPPITEGGALAGAAGTQGAPNIRRHFARRRNPLKVWLRATGVALSLGLSLAAVVAWKRSYSRTATWSRQRNSGWTELSSARGRLYLLRIDNIKVLRMPQAIADSELYSDYVAEFRPGDTAFFRILSDGTVITSESSLLPVVEIGWTPQSQFMVLGITRGVGTLPAGRSFHLLSASYGTILLVCAMPLLVGILRHLRWRARFRVIGPQRLEDLQPGERSAHTSPVPRL